MLKVWIEAMRLRTLPVSVAGVFAGTACAALAGRVLWAPAAICLIFAILAQTASNFANEYFDYKKGIDRPGRVGPRRGVTEGDITPAAMARAISITLGLALGVGLSLIIWGGWWLIAAGAVIALGALAYSAGPYPLSQHAFGEVAVLVFFGIVPVNLTAYVQTGGFDWTTFQTSVAIGLMGANVLLVNNYRDLEDDFAVSKTTLATLLGRKTCLTFYVCNGFAAVALTISAWQMLPCAWLAVPAVYLVLHTVLSIRLAKGSGASLNPLLGITATLMAAYALLLFAAAILHSSPLPLHN